MAGRTPAKAFREFRESIQEAIACFAHTGVTGTTQQPGEIGILTVNRGKPLSLDATDRQIEIACSIKYTIRRASSERSGSWRVSTVSYVHSVSLDGKSAVDFHWHPDDGSNIWYPHIHPYFLGSGRDQGGMHIPSGRVLVEDVLIFAHERGAIPLKDEWEDIVSRIGPQGSRPRAGRPLKDEWEDIVSRIKKRVAQEATWGAPSLQIYRPEPDS